MFLLLCTEKYNFRAKKDCLNMIHTLQVHYAHAAANLKIFKKKN